MCPICPSGYDRVFLLLYVLCPSISAARRARMCPICPSGYDREFLLLYVLCPSISAARRARMCPYGPPFVHRSTHIHLFKIAFTYVVKFGGPQRPVCTQIHTHPSVQNRFHIRRAIRGPTEALPTQSKAQYTRARRSYSSAAAGSSAAAAGSSAAAAGSSAAAAGSSAAAGSISHWKRNAPP